jgi:hypothetical protein
VNGYKIIKIAGVKAFAVSPLDEKTMNIGILNKKTMIACSKQADFGEVVARLSGTKNPNFKAASFKRLLESVNGTRCICVVATSDMLVKLAENAPEGVPAQAKQVLEILKQMDGFCVTVTIEKNIDFHFGLNTKKPETAAKLARALSNAVGTRKAKVAEQAKKDETLKPALDILNTMRVTPQAGGSVGGRSALLLSPERPGRLRWRDRTHPPGECSGPCEKGRDPAEAVEN